MSLLQIAQLGHPVLRRKAKIVKDDQLHSQVIRQLIGDMLATLEESGGVGVAAPQVYHSLQIMIVASTPTPSYPHAPKMKPMVMINPQLVSHSEEIVDGWEGCLSIPQLRGLTPRFQSITIQYTTPKGKIIKKKYTDFVARIFQHEYDHLQGILFIDRIKSSQDLISEKEFQKLLKKQLAQTSKQ